MSHSQIAHAKCPVCHRHGRECVKVSCLACGACRECGCRCTELPPAPRAPALRRAA